MWNLDKDWYTPRSFLSAPTQYDFPGDRFIPNRSLMNLDQAHSLLTNRSTKNIHNQHFNEAYRQKLDEQLTMDSDGRPFRMLVFRGCPKSNKNSIRHMDVLRQQNATEFQINRNQRVRRKLPQKESKVLDAPEIRNDFFTNTMDWGKNNILAVALGKEMYLWNSVTSDVSQLFKSNNNNYPTSVSWSEDSKYLAAGFMHSNLHLYDVVTSKLIRKLEGHSERIAALAWNGNILTSGSHDKSIINHDVRARSNVTSQLKGHREAICSLKWSKRGNMLASGGSESLVHVWESKKMNSSNFLHCFKDHNASVKALAWCPYDSSVLASGGGVGDGCIKLWNVQKGTNICSIDTKAEISGLEWNRHQKEILSGHGFSSSAEHNQLCLWEYPSMTKVGTLGTHTSRVLHLSQSPNGLTVVSAGADESLRFWNVFGPPATKTKDNSGLDNVLSMKAMLIR